MSINFTSTTKYFVVEIYNGKETRITQKFAFQGDAIAALKRQKPEPGITYKVVSE